jgi:hypothetical protein
MTIITTVIIFFLELAHIDPCMEGGYFQNTSDYMTSKSRL